MNVSVIGAGTMGNGIAHVFAQHGHAVTLLDLDRGRLDAALGTIGKNLDRQVKKELLTEAEKDATLGRITTGTHLAGGVAEADLVVEAATENPRVKAEIFRQMDEAAPRSAILATNTSSISITEIAAATTRRSR
jgi:3-hydroxybutyryl-CoA dehydrogenase